MRLEFDSSQTASDLLLDSFHVGLAVTDSECNILLANSYACDLLSFQLSEISNTNLNDLMTKPSKIIYESYIIPMLLRDKVCEEVQITLFDSYQVRKDLLVNINIDADEEFFYWSFVSLEKHKAHISALLARNKEREAIIKKLQLERERDELTGLYTRKYFFDHINKIVLEHKYNRKKIRFFMFKLDSIKFLSAKSYDEEDTILIMVSEILKEYNSIIPIFSRLSGSVFVGCYFINSLFSSELIEIELVKKLTALDNNILFSSLTTTSDIKDIDHLLKGLRNSLHKKITL